MSLPAILCIIIIIILWHNYRNAQLVSLYLPHPNLHFNATVARCLSYFKWEVHIQSIQPKVAYLHTAEIAYSGYGPTLLCILYYSECTTDKPAVFAQKSISDTCDHLAPTYAPMVVQSSCYILW